MVGSALFGYQRIFKALSQGTRFGSSPAVGSRPTASPSRLGNSANGNDQRDEIEGFLERDLVGGGRTPNQLIQGSPPPRTLLSGGY